MAPAEVARRQRSPAKESGRQLRDSCERKQAYRSELCLARQPVVHIGEKQNCENRQAPDSEEH